MSQMRPWWLIVATCAALIGMPLAANAQGPAFKVDPSWPKPLPNNWILGQVGGMTVDAHDNIWVFSAAALTDRRRERCRAQPAAFEVLCAGSLGAGVQPGR